MVCVVRERACTGLQTRRKRRPPPRVDGTKRCTFVAAPGTGSCTQSVREGHLDVGHLLCEHHVHAPVERVVHRDLVVGVEHLHPACQPPVASASLPSARAREQAVPDGKREGGRESGRGEREGEREGGRRGGIEGGTENQRRG